MPLSVAQAENPVIAELERYGLVVLGYASNFTRTIALSPRARRLRPGIYN
jgi:hypothetical protein